VDQDLEGSRAFLRKCGTPGYLPKNALAALKKVWRPMSTAAGK
jgi:hypothetical protein